MNDSRRFLALSPILTLLFGCGTSAEEPAPTPAPAYVAPASDDEWTHADCVVACETAEQYCEDHPEIYPDVNCSATGEVCRAGCDESFPSLPKPPPVIKPPAPPIKKR